MSNGPLGQATYTISANLERFSNGQYVARSNWLDVVMPPQINQGRSEIENLSKLLLGNGPSYMPMNMDVAPGSTFYSEEDQDMSVMSISNRLRNFSENLPEQVENKYVTIEQLNKLGWSDITDEQVEDLNYSLKKYDITTPERIRHFLSQCSHESGLGIWTQELASGDDYEYREDLGNIYQGDGPRYKGAGYIQLTGRSNYQRFADEMSDPKIMDGVDYVSKNYPWSSAGSWWNANGMNQIIDSGASVKQVTRRVNGGYNGLAEREKYYQRSEELFGN